MNKKYSNEGKYKNKPTRTGWLLFLVFCVGLTSSLIGLIMGRIVTLDHYSGHMVETIVLSIQPYEEQERDKNILNIFNLAGKVLYTDGTPYSNGNVELWSQPRHAQTDIHGYFIFYNVEEGEHVINIIQNGIVIASSQVLVEKGEHYTESQVVRLDNGDYLVMLSLDVIHIELVLIIQKDGELVLSINTGPPFSVRESTELDDGGFPTDPDAPVNLVDPLPPLLPSIPRTVKPPERTLGVEAREDAIGSTTWSQETPINIFGKKGGANYGIIAPGDSGTCPFLIKNIESHPISYSINLAEIDENLPNVPLKYRLKTSGTYLGGNQWKSAEEIQSGIKMLAPGSSGYYTLEWKWITELDTQDTMIGMQGENRFYKLLILINAQLN